MNDGRPGARDVEAEVVANYNVWRAVANMAGSGGPYDEPDWEDGRLFFRSDYSEKIKKWPAWAKSGYWGAWIIGPAHDECFYVAQSLLHERAAERSEDLQAVFSHFTDAGKYIILQIGDSLRYQLGLETLSIKWAARGLNPRIQVALPEQDVVEFVLRRSPGLEREFAEKHLKKFVLQGDVNSYGFAFPEDQPSMEVLALSFDELTAALLEGMPDSITSQVPRWRE
jgi:hypothetical protein